MIALGIMAALIATILFSFCIHANCIKQSEVDPTGRENLP